jgi:hypothetical protein
MMNLTAKRVFVIGDVHADFPALNKLIVRREYPDVVIQVGDFGWWPHFHNTNGFGGNKLFDQYGLRPGTTKILWIDGNHDNHDDLQLLVEKHGRVPIEVQENVFFMPRGSTATINNKEYLFMGGADSIDRHMRIPGVSWWRGELINEKDLMALPEKKIDVVISHTCPTYFKMKHDEKFNDPSRRALDYVFDKYNPKKWYFGHFHEYIVNRTKGCSWKCLDMLGGYSRSWDNIVGSAALDLTKTK